MKYISLVFLPSLPGLPIFLKYLISLFIDLKIMKKTGKNTLLKLEGLKNLARTDELRTVIIHNYLLYWLL